MPFKSYKKESRADWGDEKKENGPLRRDQIKLGAILRIADSLEKMEKPFQELISRAEMYERWYNQAKDERDYYKHSRNALRGIVNKLKKKK